MAWENGYLKVVKKGIDSPHEASTSKYVFDVLRYCLNWKTNDIHCQKRCRRGFVDYSLDYPTSKILLEVKRFKSRLKDKHIERYLVNTESRPQNIDVGVVTNLTQWHVYVAGKHVKQVCGEEVLRLKTIEIRNRKDINDLRKLIGWRGNGHHKEIRALFCESQAVLRYLISIDQQVLKAVRGKLADLRDRHRIDISVPQNDSLREWIGEVLNGHSVKFSGWSTAKLKQALGSKPVAVEANKILQDLFGCRLRHNKVRRTIRQILKYSESPLVKVA